MTTRPSFVSIGGQIYFVANSTGLGATLWRTDGTTSGTNEIAPSTNYSITSSLVATNSTVYFAAEDGINGRELWRSDGTAAGTFMLKDVNPSSQDSIEYHAQLRSLFVWGSTLFFAADDGVNGRELWKSDGSSAGTVLLNDFISGSGDSNPRKFTSFGSKMFLAVDNSDEGSELFTYDGTTFTRVSLENSVSVQPQWLRTTATRLFFAGNTTSRGIEPWMYSLPDVLVVPTPTTNPVTIDNSASQIAVPAIPSTPTSSTTTPSIVSASPTTTIARVSASRAPSMGKRGSIPQTGGDTSLALLALAVLTAGALLRSVAHRRAR